VQPQHPTKTKRRANISPNNRLVKLAPIENREGPAYQSIKLVAHGVPITGKNKKIMKTEEEVRKD